MQLQPGERGTDAEMQARAKGDIGLDGAGRDELIRAFPLGGIPVGSCQKQRHAVAALKCVAHHLDLLIGPAGEHVQRRIIAQNLFSGRLNRIGGEGRARGLGFQQGFRAIADGMNCRFMARVQQQDAG